MNKPWIKLIKTPLGFYVYDVNRNEVVTVNKNVYEDLDRWLENNQENLSEETKELIRCGFFSPKEIIETGLELNPISKQKIHRNMSMLCIQVTQRCNLRCEYCVYSEERNLAQRSHQNKSMTFDTAKKGIDYYALHSVDEDTVYIAFYGGEPLLEFNLIKHCVEYSEKKFEGKRIQFSVTTNGTLLTKEVADFFDKHNIKTMISLDGPQNIHDRFRVFGENRLGSFEIIKENIKRIKIENPDYYKTLLIHSVVNPDNDLFELDSIKNDDILGSIENRFSLVDYTYDDLLSKKKFPKKYVEDYEYSMFLARLNHYGLLKSTDQIPNYILKNSDLLDQNAERVLKPMFTPASMPSGQCLFGQTKLFMDCDGNFYPCEKVAESEYLKIGDVNNGLDYDKITTLYNTWRLTERECSNCWAFRLCNICIHHCYKNNCVDKERRLSYCEGSQRTALHYILSKIQEFEISYLFKKFLRKDDIYE